MDKNVILAVFLLLFIAAADVSSAKFRHLAAVDPNDNSAKTKVRFYYFYYYFFLFLITKQRN